MPDKFIYGDVASRRIYHLMHAWGAFNPPCMHEEHLIYPLVQDEEDIQTSLN